MSSEPVYNERSWAIDLITEINLYAVTKKLAIRKAGGEYGLKIGKKTLFPDVLLFGVGNILHGWELKMPDVSISDVELIFNATIKAKHIKSNSFLVWNGGEAKLFKLNQETQNYESIHSWIDHELSTRLDMKIKSDRWKKLLHTILDDLNSFFQNGELKAQTFEHTFGEMLITNMIESLYSFDANAIKDRTNIDATFEAEIDRWWALNEFEYTNFTKFEAIARVNIVNWINKIFFGQYLKGFHQSAWAIDQIVADTSIDEAISILESITESCDFMNVFKNGVADQTLSEDSWREIKALNNALSKIDVSELPNESFRSVLDNALSIARRKLAGQFSTPENLASLLVRLSIDNRAGDTMDPCCGTGTIPKAAYNLKVNKGMSPRDALSTIWASDKFQFPLQITSIILSDPSAMGEVVQVFRSDVFDLEELKNIDFVDPSQNGKVSTRDFPKFNTIVSNLPFVQFEDSAKLNPKQYESLDKLEDILGIRPILSKKADLYSYITPYLYRLLTTKGTVGVIISNSWLGTESGEEFRELLLRLFEMRWVLISGSGKWFDNAAVVTTMLILIKRDEPVDKPSQNEKITFVTTMRNIKEWDEAYIDEVNNSLRLESSCLDLKQQTHTIDEICLREKFGLSWNSMFVDTEWIVRVGAVLIKIDNYFHVGRGERRGWDEMFYPKGNHQIEQSFLKPVLLSSKSITSLVATPDGEAFCCSESENFLKEREFQNALKWINNFRHKSNNKGKPLTKVLSKKGYYWYEMRPDTLATMAISMNPDRVLAVFRFTEPTFVNQRLIRFTPKDSTTNEDTDIIHALMNTVIGMFMIEASGFGRGLGVLDLNATKISEGFHVLDFTLLHDNHRSEILAAFASVKNRKQLPLEQEIYMPDREFFEKIVFHAYNMDDLYNPIRLALLSLYGIRKSVRD